MSGVFSVVNSGLVQWSSGLGIPPVIWAPRFYSRLNHIFHLFLYLRNFCSHLISTVGSRDLVT